MAFKVNVGTVSDERAKTSADDLEKQIGEIMNGVRKASKISIEDMAVLIQFVRNTLATRAS